MGLPNITERIIASGHNCKVKVVEKEGDESKTIALVASFQATEDFQVQEATCIGNLGPISIDPQGYTCSLTLDGFLPSKKTKLLFHDGSGTEALMRHMPEREDFMTDGDIQKFFAIEFHNKNGQALASFKGVIVTSNGVSAEGSSYVRNNVQMRALSWDKDGWND